MNFAEYSTYPEIKIALVTDRVDAFSVDRSILNGYVDDSTMLLDAQFAPQEYDVATKKSNTELADQVDAAIGAMADDGTLTALQERWGLSTETPAGEEEGGACNGRSKESAPYACQHVQLCTAHRSLSHCRGNGNGYFRVV